MNWELLGTAFCFGLLSACSLPLGAITSFFWMPAERVVAVLMAFGAGALLAALTIDLVAPTVGEQDFVWLSLGCVVGGLLFLCLNQMVNDFGGFLRKVGTTINYLRQEQHSRFRKLLYHLHRLEALGDLSKEQINDLASQAVCRSWEAGTCIYRVQDLVAGIYLIEEGTVELHRPHQRDGDVVHLGKNDAFGHMALLTGSLHTTEAIVTSEAEVWFIPKSAVKALFEDRITREAIAGFLHSPPVQEYLVRAHRLSPTAATERTNSLIHCLETSQTLPEFEKEQSPRSLAGIKRVPIFQDLSEADQQQLAEKAIWKQLPSGHTFFHQHDPCDRMYIIDSGEVTLIDPASRSRAPEVLHEHDAFGGLSFLTGTKHTTTAVAATDCAVWVLRKEEFNELLTTCKPLARAVQDFLRKQQVADYLHFKHQIEPAKVSDWMQKALGDLEAGKYVPSIGEAVRSPQILHGAPLAIWLGILLDGVPESLVIGSSMHQAHLSVSLIGGLFLSNYPEALSSSVGLKQQGYTRRRILLMWAGLMLFTGLGAALGNLFFLGVPSGMSALIEGVAAGAMLTMIAETMLPEAYFKGGSFISLATLFGFLAAIFLKFLEGPISH